MTDLQKFCLEHRETLNKVWEPKYGDEVYYIPGKCFFGASKPGNPALIVSSGRFEKHNSQVWNPSLEDALVGYEKTRGPEGLYCYLRNIRNWKACRLRLAAIKAWVSALESNTTSKAELGGHPAEDLG